MYDKVRKWWSLAVRDEVTLRRGIVASFKAMKQVLNKNVATEEVVNRTCPNDLFEFLQEIKDEEVALAILQILLARLTNR